MLQQINISICAVEGLVMLPCNDILYVVSSGHVLTIHTTSKEKYHLYDKLDDFESRIGSSDYLRIQKSYLVNIHHIRRISYCEAELHSGIILPISRKKYPYIKHVIQNRLVSNCN